MAIKYTKKSGLGKGVHKISQPKAPLKKGNKQLVAIGRAIKKEITHTGPAATCLDMVAVINTCADFQTALSSWLVSNTTIINIQGDITNLDARVTVLEGAGYITCADLATCPTIVNIQSDISNKIECADLLTGTCRENIEDIVGDMATNGVQAGIQVTYDDVNGVLNFITAPGCGDFCDQVAGCPVIVDHEIRISALESGGPGSDDYVTSGSFNPATNILTLTRILGGVVNVDLSSLADTDVLVKASATDSTAGYLDAKVKNSIEVNLQQMQLVNDSAAPGINKYYGTDNTGIKGYHDLIGQQVSKPITASVSDTFIHNLGKFPHILCIDGSGNMIVPANILYSSNTTVVVTWNVPFTGTIYAS